MGWLVASFLDEHKAAIRGLKKVRAGCPEPMPAETGLPTGTTAVPAKRVIETESLVRYGGEEVTDHGRLDERLLIQSLMPQYSNTVFSIPKRAFDSITVS